MSNLRDVRDFFTDSLGESMPGSLRSGWIQFTALGGKARQIPVNPPASCWRGSPRHYLSDTLMPITPLRCMASTRDLAAVGDLLLECRVPRTRSSLHENDLQPPPRFGTTSHVAGTPADT
jgi:hypothetical protein